MLAYAITKADLKNVPLNLGTDVCYKEAHCLEEYVDIANRYRMKQSPLASKRFSDYNACFAAFCNNNTNHIISSGWYVGSCRQFPITEINKMIDIPDGAYMLFDFFTDDMYQRQGYYTKLLNHICLQLDGNWILIGVSESNIPSRKAIEKNGFTSVGSFRCCSCCYHEIMAKYGIITRGLVIFCCILSSTLAGFLR